MLCNARCTHLARFVLDHKGGETYLPTVDSLWQTMASTSILVLGAGELGGAILGALTSHTSKGQSKISALLRPASIHSQHESKQKEIGHIRTLDIELVEGDIVQDSAEQLAPVFGRYDTVINAVGMYAPAGTQVKLCKAALASGCQRYFPWQYGVDYDIIGRNSSQNLFTEQLDVRALLREQSKMKWVIVSTGMFTSFLFEPAFDLVNAERTKVTAIGSWQNSITVTAPQDIGKLTAEIALAAPEIQGVVYTAGDTVSMQQLADIVDQVSGRKVERVLKDVAQLKQELAAEPDDGMRKYRVVFGEGKGVSWDREKTFNAQRGVPTETALEWATKNL